MNLLQETTILLAQLNARCWKEMTMALAGGDKKSLHVLCDKNLERRHVKTLEDSTMAM